MTNEKKVKELLYRLEDVTALGVSLPLVAFSQLAKNLSDMKAYRQESNDAAMAWPIRDVEQFIDKHMGDYGERDERALVNGFQRMKKAHPDRLDEWRTWHGTLSCL